ncbi:hypothetical protein LXL04_024542 [Taraxacum kok-saghyz]
MRYDLREFCTTSIPKNPQLSCLTIEAQRTVKKLKLFKIRSFGTGGQTKDGVQIMLNEKVYKYNIFCGIKSRYA